MSLATSSAVVGLSVVVAPSVRVVVVKPASSQAVSDSNPAIAKMSNVLVFMVIPWLIFACDIRDVSVTTFPTRSPSKREGGRAHRPWRQAPARLPFHGQGISGLNGEIECMPITRPTILGTVGHRFIGAANDGLVRV
jgi:hypothetical protein